MSWLVFGNAPAESLRETVDLFGLPPGETRIEVDEDFPPGAVMVVSDGFAEALELRWSKMQDPKVWPA